MNDMHCVLVDASRETGKSKAIFIRILSLLSSRFYDDLHVALLTDTQGETLILFFEAKSLLGDHHK